MNRTGIFEVKCNDGVKRVFVAGVVSPTFKFTNLRCTHCHAVLKHLRSLTEKRTIHMLKYHSCDDIPPNRMTASSSLKIVEKDPIASK